MIALNITMTEFSVEEATQVLEPLIYLIIGMTVYAIFTFKFYRFLGKKNIFKLNLNQYNNVGWAWLNKFVAFLFYVLEFLIIFPLFVFFWFLVIVTLISLMSDSTLNTVLLAAMALVAAIRISAYYNEDLSKDLSKMFPFALLAVFILDITTFNLGDLINMGLQMLDMWKIIVYYLGLTISLELILRIWTGVFSLFKKD